MENGNSSQNAEEQSILGSLYSWGTSLMDYAQTQITRFHSYFNKIHFNII